jgi:2-phosphosulfolactate phosphatase
MKSRVERGVAGGRALVGTRGPIVVIDALRMSATAIVALHLGMDVIPVLSAEEAVALKVEGVLTAGERGGEKIPSLDLGNSPSELLRWRRGAAQALALTTSCGVPCLLAVAAHPRPVLVGSPLNLSSLAARIEREDPSELGILLSSEKDGPSDEDAMTASLLLARLGAPIPEGLPPPISTSQLEGFFLATESARRLLELGYEGDIRLCAEVDRYSIVPEYRGGRLRPGGRPKVSR